MVAGHALPEKPSRELFSTRPRTYITNDEGHLATRENGLKLIAAICRSLPSVLRFGISASLSLSAIRSVLRTDSRTSDEGAGLLEAKIRAQTAQERGYLPYNRLEYMQLMNMITDDVVMR